MRKIRGFKLNLRIKEVQRRAKKAGIDLAALDMASDGALTALIEQFSSRARPSVLYDTFPPDKPKSAANGTPSMNLSPLPGLAYSLALATLGLELPSFVDERVKAAPGLKPLLDVMANAALDDAKRFVLGLVEEEAKLERCDLSPIHAPSEPAVLQEIVARLDGHKISVAADASGLQPPHTAALSLSWISRSRSRAK